MGFVCSRENAVTGLPFLVIVKVAGMPIPAIEIAFGVKVYPLAVAARPAPDTIGMSPMLSPLEWDIVGVAAELLSAPLLQPSSVVTLAAAMPTSNILVRIS